MIFTRTCQYRFSIPKEHLKHRFVGNHVKIHNLDFEVQDNEHYLQIIPHAEQINSIKTLPITRLSLEEDGNKTKVVVTTKMRKLDSGGPMLIMLFCVFMIVTSVVLYYIGQEPLITYSMLGVTGIIFLLFFIRMQMGYFDYVRKIKAYVKFKGDQITTDVRRQLFKHKLS